MENQQDKAAFICVKDTIDGAYPSLILGINAARQGMESKIFYSFMGLNMVVKGGSQRAKFIPDGVMGAIPGIWMPIMRAFLSSGTRCSVHSSKRAMMKKSAMASSGSSAASICCGRSFTNGSGFSRTCGAHHGNTSCLICCANRVGPMMAAATHRTRSARVG